jgi:O-acetyl-ADP-ribose deacetylase (regulator of RNase III)
VIEQNGIRSVAVPPLGCGNGGLDWSDVRTELVRALSDLKDVEVLVYEPTDAYQNVAERRGVQKVTP